MTQKQFQLQARELKYRASFLMSDVKVVCKLHWRIGVSRTVAVKIELSQLEKDGTTSSATV